MTRPEHETSARAIADILAGRDPDTIGIRLLNGIHAHGGAMEARWDQTRRIRDGKENADTSRPHPDGLTRALLRTTQAHAELDRWTPYITAHGTPAERDEHRAALIALTESKRRITDVIRRHPEPYPG